jgi:hypothetical protein
MRAKKGLEEAMKRFLLQRLEDDSGVSGRGFVAEGVQFTDGLCALTWRYVNGERVAIGDWSSVAVYPSLDKLNRIHGHGGTTLIRFIDAYDPPHQLDCPAIVAGGVGCDCNLGITDQSPTYQP